MIDHDRCALPRPADDAAGLDERRARLRSLIGVLVAAGTILGVLIAFARAHTGTVHRIDVTTAVRLNEYVARHPAEVTFWKVVTNIGGPLTWRVLAGVAAVALWWRRRRRDAVIIALAMITAAVVSGLLKALVDRHRPIVPDPVDHVGGASFPSGHALTSFTALGLVVLLLWQVISLAQRTLLTAAAVVLAAAVAFSRLILGVHYLTDVIGGWVSGVALLAATMAAATWSERSTAA